MSMIKAKLKALSQVYIVTANGIIYYKIRNIVNDNNHRKNQYSPRAFCTVTIISIFNTS